MFLHACRTPLAKASGAQQAAARKEALRSKQVPARPALGDREGGAWRENAGALALSSGTDGVFRSCPVSYGLCCNFVAVVLPLWLASCGAVGPVHFHTLHPGGRHLAAGQSGSEASEQSITTVDSLLRRQSSSGHPQMCAAWSTAII